MLKMIFLQFCAAIVATAIGAVFFGSAGGISAAVAGAACVVPNALFAWRLNAVARKAGTPPVSAFFVGELIKVASIVGLLALAMGLYQDLHWGGLMIGLVFTLKANLFAFWVKS